VSEQLSIIGVYDKQIVDFDENTSKVDIINAKLCKGIVLQSKTNHGVYYCRIQSMQGKILSDTSIEIRKGIMHIDVPACGIIRLKKI